MHLSYSYITAFMDFGENRHAQEVMKELGIKYQYAMSQPLCDSFLFWNCENTPEKLPSYLKEIKANPMECIGHGLDKKTAEKIRDYKKPWFKFW